MMNTKPIRRIQALHVVKTIGQLQPPKASTDDTFTKVSVCIQQQELKFAVRAVIEVRLVGIKGSEACALSRTNVERRRSTCMKLLLFLDGLIARQDHQTSLTANIS